MADQNKIEEAAAALAGFTRANAIDWAKEDKFDSYVEQVRTVLAITDAAAPADPEQAKLDSLAQAGLAAALENHAKGEQMGGAQVAKKEFNAEQMAHLINRLSVANRRDGWRGAAPEYGREDLQRAKEAVDKAEQALVDYVKSLATTTERAAEGEATERKPLTIVEAKAEAAAPEAPDDAQGTPYFRDVEFDPPSGLFTTITSMDHGIGSGK